MAAKPDLDDGWLKYAHELDAALAVADFTKGARVVLRNVFAQIFGMAKLKTATISPSCLSEKVGMAREQVSRAVKELVDAGVLTKMDDGSFRFVKNYESWTRKGEPRLTAKEVEFCRAARDESLAYAFVGRLKNGAIRRDDSVTDGVTESSQDRDSLVTPPVTESSRKRDSLVTETVTELSRSEAPPYRNAGAEFEKGEVRQAAQESDAVLKFGPQPPKAESCPAYPEGDGGMYEITPSRFPMDEGRAQAIFRMLWNGWSNSRMCFAFYQRQQFYTEDVWIAAIRNAKHRDVSVGSLGYIEAIAADYQANGIPKPKPAQAAPRHSGPTTYPIKPLHPPGTVIPSKYLPRTQPAFAGGA